jgi:ABC-type cobalamin/Fe3+-siderophores transport system ATPase subunit
MRYQQEITELIGGWSRDKGGTVVFVTHDVNPVLGYATASCSSSTAAGPPAARTRS